MQRKYKLGYDKFRINLYGVILCTGLFTSIEGISKGNEMQEDSTSLIAEFVQNFMKPYIEAHSGKVESPYKKERFQKSPYQQPAPETDSTYPKSTLSSSIRLAIEEVVNELQPYLQDDEHDYHKYLENDETTIIEFLPKSELHGKPWSQEKVPNIYRYEKMKSDIKLALEKENVSDKTKRMVTKTLDELIAQVLRNKCNWRSVKNISSVLRSGQPSITSQEWDDLKTQYLEFLNKKQVNWSRALNVFNNFHDFFSKVIKETQSMSGRSRLKCQVIDEGRTLQHRSTDACMDFKVCSTELKDFLQSIYDSFNETVVSVFTNYAAMYIRDVSAGEHGNTVSKVLQKAAKIVEQRVGKVYIQELPTFRLDENRTQNGNIKILRNHVKGTMKRVLKLINKHIYTDLSPIKTKLLEIIQKDLGMNLNVELGNQETELKQRICTVFMTCNGRVSDSRRSFSGSNNNAKQINPKSIFVELKISVDEKKNVDVSQLPRGTNSTTQNYKNHTFRVTRTTVYANNSSNVDINLVK